MSDYIYMILGVTGICDNVVIYASTDRVEAINFGLDVLWEQLADFHLMTYRNGGSLCMRETFENLRKEMDDRLSMHRVNILGCAHG